MSFSTFASNFLRRCGGQRSSCRLDLSKEQAEFDRLKRQYDELMSDIQHTHDLLTEAETAYQKKAEALVGAKANLDRARHDLQHANIEAERAAARAAQAAQVAGLAVAPTAGLTVALNVMKASADDARRKAQAMDMKATALKHESPDDANITEALKEASGTPSTQSLADRLASLRR